MQPNETIIMSNDIRNQHGAVCWGELMTENPEAASAFYRKVFGWTSETTDMPDGSQYTCFTTHEGAKVAGAMKPPVEGMPNHWGLHMTVTDVDQAIATTVAEGGKVLKEPFDCTDMRIAYLADPQGACFAIIQFNKPI